MKSRLLAGMLVAGLAVPAAGWALAQTQSLGEVARKTREEREKMAKKPTRVYTNADFPEPAPPPAAEETETEGPPASEARSAANRQSEEARSREDWERLFRAARENLRSTQEIRDLVEDELNLLRIQRARELAPTAQAELDEQINAKLADLEARRRAAAEAQKALEDLEKEFEESGAPEDWMPPDENPASAAQS